MSKAEPPEARRRRRKFCPPKPVLQHFCCDHTSRARASKPVGMPLLRKETIHGWRCSFYDNDRVMVGTTARSRFTMNVPADETSWFATRLRAELIERELATAEELPVDDVGEAAMAAKAAAAESKAASKAALKMVKDAAVAKAEAEAALAGAEYDVAKAELKRGRAELKLEAATFKAKVAKVVPVVSHLAQQTPAAAPLQAKMESFFRRPVG